ncbi:MAG: 3-dehydroquinate synthase [Ignisphaera sp.]
MKIIDERICCIDTKIFIGRNIIGYLREIVKNGKVLIVRQKSINIDQIVEVLGDNIHELVLEGGEQDKDLDTVINIIDYLYREDFQRNDYVIAVGGGTLTDVVGFATSIYMRGIRLINIPTTLLGMVDAAIGGKNAVNFRKIKNVIGTFYQPHVVIADIGFLDTLPENEYLNGLAEVIKYGVILDKSLFSYLENNVDGIINRRDDVVEYIVYKAILNKLNVVKEDPYELKGIRIVLNFGHTVGHAIEAASGFIVPHGKAVAVGMVIETILGTELGITNSSCVKLIENMLRKYSLPTSIKDLSIIIDINDVIKSIARDKKRRGNSISMPILVDIGTWVKHEVTIDRIERGIAKWIG